MLLPERAPTGDERSRWSDFVKLADRVMMMTGANGLRLRNYETIARFAESVGIKTVDPTEAKKELNIISADILRIKKAIALVEANELGIQFSVDGEISIVAPTSYTKEQIASYGLGAWPLILIGVGIVLIGGIVARALWMESKNAELESKVDGWTKFVDGELCKDPNDPKCAAWKTEKAKDYTPTKNTIDRLVEGLAEVGTTAKKGLGWGIAIAIPLLAWGFLKK